MIGLLGRFVEISSADMNTCDRTVIFLASFNLELQPPCSAVSMPFRHKTLGQNPFMVCPPGIIVDLGSPDLYVLSINADLDSTPTYSASFQSYF